MYHFILLVLFVIFIVSLMANYKNISSPKKNKNIIRQNRLYLSNPTKCFSCQNQLDYPNKYIGGRSKCFSCENEFSNQFGSQYASLGQGSKCFDCQSELL